MTTCQQAVVDDHKIFYRESGPTDAPSVLLLHGFSTSSHMFRNLIPALADRFHIIAPDVPGFRFTESGVADALRISTSGRKGTHS